MKVILLEDIKNIGKKFDVKDISDGYVRNFLLPKKLVKLADQKALKALSEFKTNLAKENVELTKHLTELAKILTERHLEFELKTDKDGSVFGSINKENILKGLYDAGIIINKEQIDIKLERPLKKIGEHVVPVHFKKGITANLKLVIRPQR
jgi:large subunit ribosomal protein L9